MHNSGGQRRRTPRRGSLEGVLAGVDAVGGGWADGGLQCSGGRRPGGGRRVPGVAVVEVVGHVGEVEDIGVSETGLVGAEEAFHRRDWRRRDCY